MGYKANSMRDESKVALAIARTLHLSLRIKQYTWKTHLLPS